MNYIVIVPAYNEAANIGRLIQSIVKQTMLPKQLIIVDDGSTDQTAELVKAMAVQHKWITLIQNKQKTARAVGAKVVKAFLLGYKNIADNDYEFVTKLDADLSLPTHYFETIAQHFEQSPQLGLVGGVCSIFEKNKWNIERVADADHVRGALKSYRKICLEEIGGLRASMGWDTVDELLCAYYGWDVMVDDTLVVKHYRTTGEETGMLKSSIKCGKAMYYQRYGFFIALIAFFKRGMILKPYGLTGLYAFYGFLTAFFKKEPFIINEQEGKFVRQYRSQRIIAKLKKLINV